MSRSTFLATLAAAVVSVVTASAAADKPLYKSQDCSKLTVQMDLNECAGTNAAAADTALNAVYKRLLKGADSSGASGLRDSERAWVAYRDKECAREVGPQADGGSIWPMEMSNCLEDKTAARIRELSRNPD